MRKDFEVDRTRSDSTEQHPMKKFLISAAVLLIVLFSSAASYFTSVLLDPGGRSCNPEHFYYCSDPSEAGLKFENVSFAATDGSQVSGWLIPGEKGRPAVLFVHGWGATRLEGLRYAPSLHKRGFTCLLIDLRGRGKSAPAVNSMGYHERKDVFGAVDYLLNVVKVPDVGIYGFSMGGATSILAMAEDKRIKAGVIEGAFSDFSLAVEEGAKSDYGLPKYPLLPVVTWIYEWRAHLKAEEISPIKVVASISPRPIFFIHPYDDDRVPFHHGKDLYEAAGNPKFFWPVENKVGLKLTHTRAWQLDKARVEKDVPDFFQKYL